MAQQDENPLDTIKGKATILSAHEFSRRYPSGRIPKTSKDYGTTFVCRRGCNARTATYTQEFDWAETFRGPGDIEALKERIESQTKSTRKRKATALSKSKDLDGFVIDDDDDEGALGPKTPSKRRKLNDGGTPRSKTSARQYTTPTHRRIVAKKPLEFTPLGTRILSPHHLWSPFQVARSQLHVSAVPTSLPCREEEFSTVYSCLEAAITDGTGSCIYISGVPGTGKTATVREVIAQLNASVQAEELDDFIFVEINGMKVTDPHQAYSLLWEALTNERVSPTHALGLLEREFSTPSPRRVPCVVLMDELDQLVTKTQSVMYNFFNWPNLRHSRLIVLAVANTMDLPERTLSNKISSRLGLTRITFPGYNHEQLKKIVHSRLESVPGKIVLPDAIEFASRKVAQVSGDARRALDICRRAVEIAEADEQAAADAAPDTPSKAANEEERSAAASKQPAGVVTINTIRQAIREATSTPMQQYLQELPLTAKIFLAALVARVRRTGLVECQLGDVMEETKRMTAMSTNPHIQQFLQGSGASKTSSSSLPTVRIPRLKAAVVDLLSAGIVVLDSAKTERTGRVKLIVGDDEIQLAFRGDDEFAGFGLGTS
ncbi:hypothetical protein MRB53_037188 [Persea americana]|nr:hypothetical protein MRB53_037188 [Persea americana]